MKYEPKLTSKYVMNQLVYYSFVLINNINRSFQLNDPDHNLDRLKHKLL